MQRLRGRSRCHGAAAPPGPTPTPPQPQSSADPWDLVSLPNRDLNSHRRRLKALSLSNPPLAPLSLIPRGFAVGDRLVHIGAASRGTFGLELVEFLHSVQLLGSVPTPTPCWLRKGAGGGRPQEPCHRAPVAGKRGGGCAAAPGVGDFTSCTGCCRQPPPRASEGPRPDP